MKNQPNLKKDEYFTEKSNNVKPAATLVEGRCEDLEWLQMTPEDLEENKHGMDYFLFLFFFSSFLGSNTDILTAYK